MVTLTTSGIEIRVYSCFLNQNSDPDKNHFLFGYDVSIQNKNSFSVQLLTRQWLIFDSLAPKREVKGKGVIGEQPILLPGEIYRYQSYCDLKSDLGWMEGAYLFKRENEDEILEVAIPRFELSTSSKGN
ncbi:MAG: Co2+/Mg2+ efflux protein ApaG [Crocinitomicaceae bacterium]|nr:Co2+/Mg2+ efflux protein ApaG [Crocinitomicaceae bacterium]|tara:strand:+ start:4479 stop:4865 length:387 start_codon:yes stop_codon:yes gene_type:complete